MTAVSEAALAFDRSLDASAPAIADVKIRSVEDARAPWLRDVITARIADRP